MGEGDGDRSGLYPAALGDADHQFAPAKVNLTLEIAGKRPDGYHQLASLVAFADVGDRLTALSHHAGEAAEAAPVLVQGAQATDLGLASDNLVAKAWCALKALDAGLVLPCVRLEKHLPVAAGLGGGSADAAAYLRMVSAANPDRGRQVDWPAVALSLGADVPVCLQSRASVMWGVGEHIRPIALAEPLHAVLVNPRCPVPETKTRDVFMALGAEPFDGDVCAPPELPGRAVALADLVDSRNDLEAPARSVMPAIDEVFSELKACSDAAVVRLSGAGPTAFALFAEAEQAGHAATAIAERHPAWWVRQATLT